MFKVRERSVSVGRNWTDWFCEFIILILLGTMHAVEVESSILVFCISVDHSLSS